MNKWFDQDNTLMRALSKVFDICYLSIVWLLFSLPIITMGASFTALYYTTVKVIRRGRGYIFSEFWRSFKNNIIQATVAWVGVLVLMGLLYTNIQIVGQDGGNISGYLIGAYVAIAILILATVCYIFPVLSRFELKMTKLIRFSFYLAMRHVPTTLVLILIAAVGVVGFAIGFIQPPAVILLFFLPALTTWMSSLLMERIFKKYMPKQEERMTEDGETITEWYME